MSLFEELKRRNVVRVGLAYLVLGWLIAQVADLLFGTFGAPDWVMRAFMIVLLLGLPIALLFAWAFEVTPEGIKREADVDRSKSITSQTGRKLDRAIIALLVLAVAYFAVDKFVLRDAAPAGENNVTADGATAADTSDHSIAVLPFVNMSDDEANEYFSDGLSEELLNVLAKNPELLVAARTSSFSLKGEKLSAIEVGERLNVAHVLEGSVRKSGNRVRITAQLIRSDNGYHLWSETWDRDLDDIFAVQDEIAKKITDDLLPHIVGDVATAASASSYTPPPEAYEQFLLAREYLNRRTRMESVRAYDIMKQLVREHPDYPEAQALYAHATYYAAARVAGDLPWIIAEPQARRALEKALNLDPNLAEAYLVEGLLHVTSRDSASAIPFFEKAIELNSSYAEAWRYLSEARLNTGDKDGAMEALQMARKLDPISITTLAWAFRQAVDNDEQVVADEALRVMRQIAPENADDLLIHYYHDQDRVAEAAIAIERFREDWPEAEPHDFHLAMSYGAMGMIDEAIAIGGPPVGYIAAEMGDRETALAVMEETASERTDPHDRADTYWRTYVSLGMYEEAAEVLSDLWYGYAAEQIGPRMDVLDVFVFAVLLRELGRDDESAAVAKVYLESDEIVQYGFEYDIAILEERYDDAMKYFIDRAGRGLFPLQYTRISPTLWVLEDHPDYPRLVEMFETWRAEQRAMYEQMKADQNR